MNNVVTIAKKKMNPLLESLLILEDRVNELEKGRETQMKIIYGLIEQIENLQAQTSNTSVPPDEVFLPSE